MHEGPRNQSLATPWAVVREIEKAIGRSFELDVCATEETAKAPLYFDEDDDGLSQPWDRLWFCNPPFNDIKSWSAKAINVEAPGVMIVPSNRTEQAWFHQLRELERNGYASLVFLQRRVNYEGGPSSAPFPSCLWGIGPDWMLRDLRQIENIPRDKLFKEST